MRKILGTFHRNNNNNFSFWNFYRLRFMIIFVCFCHSPRMCNCALRLESIKCRNSKANIQFSASSHCLREFICVRTLKKMDIPTRRGQMLWPMGRLLMIYWKWRRNSVWFTCERLYPSSMCPVERTADIHRMVTMRQTQNQHSRQLVLLFFFYKLFFFFIRILSVIRSFVRSSVHSIYGQSAKLA